MTGLQIEITYEQPVEILIEFPLAVLASHYGSSNLDEAWDDNIAYLITSTLLEHQVHIKSATLTMEQGSEKALGKLCYQLLLLVRPPLFDFNWLINSLGAVGFQRGLHLKLASKTGVFKGCYRAEFAAD
ncbi:MAG: hypothetical protein EOO60_12815 [Hymenobacter sp.]|nr:MAG: hypothetical protein EOO60_12815 [Hymenobacter sp.]